jgi:hypothetical protein
MVWSAVRWGSPSTKWWSTTGCRVLHATMALWAHSIVRAHPDRLRGRRDSASGVHQVAAMVQGPQSSVGRLSAAILGRRLSSQEGLFSAHHNIRWPIAPLEPYEPLGPFGRTSAFASPAIPNGSWWARRRLWWGMAVGAQGGLVARL